jgi:hypothetical protein
MGELLLLTTIVTLVVLTIRRGKPIILSNPLIIHRPSKYHITLAPQLNRAQSFIEAIVKKLTANVLADTTVQCFAIHDEKIAAPGEKMYLLAITSRGGMLYFQAINPQPLLRDTDSHYKTMSEFARNVLVQHPCVSASDPVSEAELQDAVLSVALEMKIPTEALHAN